MIAWTKHGQLQFSGTHNDERRHEEFDIHIIYKMQNRAKQQISSLASLYEWFAK